jgi:phasin family protein
MTPGDLDQFVRPIVETAMSATTSSLKGWGSIGEAWIAMWQSQLDHNVRLLQSLVSCDDPMTALTLHMDSARETMQRCMSAATTTSDIAAKTAAEAFAPLRAGLPSVSRAA